MSSIAQDMFSGTADPHVSESPSTPTQPPKPAPSSPPTKDPSPTDLQSPPNPMTGKPPAENAPPPIHEGAPSQAVSPQTAQPPHQNQLTEDQIAAVAQKTIEAHQQRLQQQAQQASQPTRGQQEELTPETRQELFRPVRVTADTFTGIMGYAPDNEQQVAGLQQFANAIAENALRMSMYYTARQTEQLQQAVHPLVQQQHVLAEQQQEARFVRAYPDLAEHRDLLIELRDAATARKLQFNTEKEAFDFIANHARTILTKIKGPVGQTQGQVPGVQVPTIAPNVGSTTHTMPQTSMGGATGSGNRSQGQPASTAKSVFG